LCSQVKRQKEELPLVLPSGSSLAILPASRLPVGIQRIQGKVILYASLNHPVVGEAVKSLLGVPLIAAQGMNDGKPTKSGAGMPLQKEQYLLTTAVVSILLNYFIQCLYGSNLCCNHL
jgi:hypothetical protein